MDNEVFRETYRAMNERFCPFEKSILTNNCGCRRAERFCIAEREGVHCGADAAQARCIELLDLLRLQARFTLRTIDGTTSLPHAKAMRLQVGGLRGIALALAPEQPVPVQIDDVDGLLVAAVAHFGGLDALPYTIVVQQIAAYRGRRPLRDRRR